MFRHRELRIPPARVAGSAGASRGFRRLARLGLAAAAALALTTVLSGAAAAGPAVVEAPPCACTAPTPGLTAIANATRIRSQSVTTIVSVPAGLAVPDPTEISVAFGDRRVTQTYDRGAGNRIRFDFPVGDGTARREMVAVSLLERGPGGARSFPYVRSVPVEALYDVRISALQFRLIHDCDAVGASEPEIYWSDERGPHRVRLSLHGGQYATVDAFARTLTAVGVRDGLRAPAVGWDELDPPVPATFHARPPRGIGPLLPGTTSRSNEFVQFEPDGDFCQGQFRYGTTVTLRAPAAL
ncbi:MAG: hypothetical protein AB7J32_20540 [Pseudonocardia sp.]